MTVTNNTITAIILSGGSGRGFNRKDKGWEIWRGKPLIQHCVDSLKHQVDQIIICCNRHHEQYQQLGYPLCQDYRPVFQGPLAGVEAGLKACKTDYALLFPSDSAVAPEKLASTFLQHMVEHDVDVVFLKSSPISQYLVAMMKPQLADSVSAFLDDGGRTVREWYDQLKVCEVDVNDTDGEIFNFNSPEDLL